MSRRRFLCRVEEFDGATEPPELGMEPEGGGGGRPWLLGEAMTASRLSSEMNSGIATLLVPLMLLAKCVVFDWPTDLVHAPGRKDACSYRYTAAFDTKKDGSADAGFRAEFLCSQGCNVCGAAY